MNPYLPIIVICVILSILTLWICAISFLESNSPIKWAYGLFVFFFPFSFGLYSAHEMVENPLPTAGEQFSVNGELFTVIGDPDYNKIEVRKKEGTLSAFSYTEINASYLESLHHAK